MSVVSLLNVDVKNNPAAFDAPYEFEITFECLEPLQKDLEWRVTYVGSARSSEHDQVLDCLLVGPVPVGVNKFTFETDPPNLSKIPNTEIIGVTVVILSCAYNDREFVRVGYYVNNEYTDDALAADPPAKPVIEKVRRNILAEKPRVTRFAIKWDSEDSAPAEYPPEQPEVDTAEDDEIAYGVEEVEEEEEEEEEEAPTVAETEKAEAAPTGMEGVEVAAVVKPEQKKDNEEESEEGSEDLEAESSGSEEEGEDDEDEAEAEGEADGDAEVEVDDEMDTTADAEKPMGKVADQHVVDQTTTHQPASVMAH